MVLEVSTPQNLPLMNLLTLDLYTCLNQFKEALKTEENTCKTIIGKKNSSSITLSMRMYKQYTLPKIKKGIQNP